MPPLRLSTFDPFGSSSHLGPGTPTTPDDRRASHSPRLEARGTEPVPPPPPPRWCKPPLVPTNNAAESPPPPESIRKEEVVERMTDEPSPPIKRELRRPAQRRRKPRRRRSTAPLSPQCHHSSLADKASDYEDIWGTSPSASQDEDDSKPVVLANEEDMALSDRPEEEEVDIRDASLSSSSSNSSCRGNKKLDRRRSSSRSSHKSSSSSSSSSSNSTLEKMTSVSSDRHPLPASRSVSSSSEPVYFDQEEPEGIKPPSPFQETEEPQRLSVTIIEIRDSPVINCAQEASEIQQPEVMDNQESVSNSTAAGTSSTSEIPSTEVMVRRRTSCSSTDSRGENNSKRTSPLYSEPADALPPQLVVAQARLKQNQQGRPLPLPPVSSSAPTDFTTFTKDGYVRCTLPSLTQSQTNPRVNVLPPTGQRSSTTNNRAKQISMPKPPLPPGTIESVAQRATFPSMIYLPPSGDDSLTIQVRQLHYFLQTNYDFYF